MKTIIFSKFSAPHFLGALLFVHLGSGCDLKKIDPGVGGVFVANFTVSTSGTIYEGCTVVFENKTGSADRYEWNFGDGTISQLQNPEHSFNSAGTYEVKLTAFDGNIEDDTTILLQVYQGSKFQESYNDGSGEDEAIDLVQTADGGYLLLGTTSYFGSIQFYLIKTKPNGDYLWKYKFKDDIGSLSATKLIPAEDGGYVLLGVLGTIGIGTTYTRTYAIKVDAEGGEVWRYLNDDFSSRNIMYSGVNTSDGGFLLAGRWNTDDVGILWAGYMIKLDKDGKKQSEYIEPASPGSAFYDIIPAIDEGYFIVAGSQVNNTSGNQVLIRKIDINNVSQWSQTFGTTTSDEIARSVCIGGNNNYMICGESKDGSNSAYIYLNRLDANGQSLWNNTVQNYNESVGNDIVSTNDGGFVVTGRMKSPSSDNNIFFLKVTSSNNTVLSPVIYNLSNSDIGYSIISTADCGYAIAGIRNHSDSQPGWGDAFLIKTDKNGNSQ
jgi:PKD repeat protein